MRICGGLSIRDSTQFFDYEVNDNNKAAATLRKTAKHLIKVSRHGSTVYTSNIAQDFVEHFFR